MRAGREVPGFLSKVQIHTPGALSHRVDTSASRGSGASRWTIAREPSVAFLAPTRVANRGHGYCCRAVAATSLDLAPVDLFNLNLVAEA